MNNSAFEKSVVEISFWSGEPLSSRTPLLQNFSFYFRYRRLAAIPPLGQLAARGLLTAACYGVYMHKVYMHGYMMIQGCHLIRGKHFGGKCLSKSEFSRKPKIF